MPDQEAIDALAEAWAEVDGDGPAIEVETAAVAAGVETASIMNAYRIDAGVLLSGLRSRGFDIVRKE